MKAVFATLLFLISSLAIAAPISVVNTHSCGQLKGISDPFILVLKKGENVHESILQCANDAELPGATLTGLGALERTTLSYFDHKKKTYKKKEFPEFLELLALNGNVTQFNGKRVAHIHVALSNDNYQMMGGHLANAFVGATAEIKVQPFKGKLVKERDEAIGLDLISTNH